MKNIETVHMPQAEQDLFKIYIESNYFKYFIKIMALLNTIGVFMVDYSFREELDDSNGDTDLNHKNMHLVNILALHLQLYANCVFTI